MEGTLWLSIFIVFGPPLVFIGIVFFVFRPSAKARYEAARHIPLNEPPAAPDDET